jgi:integrase
VASIKRKITKRTLAAVPADAPTEFRVWDTELRGFCLRVFPSGRRTYAVSYKRSANSRTWFKIGDAGALTPEEARRQARQLLARVAAGADPQAERAKRRDRMTVSNLIDAYLQEGPRDRPNKRASSWRNDKGYLNNHVRPFLGRRAIDELTPAELSRWQDDVALGKSPKKIWRARQHRKVEGGRGAACHSMRSFSSALGWAVERGYLALNPTARVRKLQDGRRERYLSDAEAALLMEAMAMLQDEGALSQTQADALRLIALTAARRTEVLGLRWAEVNFDRRLLILPPERHKTGGTNRAKAIPLSDGALEILNHRRDNGSPFVFPSPESALGHLRSLRHSWERIQQRTGLHDLRVHDLRHAYASFAIAAGAPLAIIGKNLGHRRASTTERYAHLRDDAGSAVAQLVDERYRAALQDSRSRSHSGVSNEASRESGALKGGAAGKVLTFRPTGTD